MREQDTIVKAYLGVADRLRALKPDPEARYSAVEARQAGLSFQDMVMVFSVAACANKEVERRLRLWAADCAARVLQLYERGETSPVPRQAIETARRFLRGELDRAAMEAACKAAADLVHEARMAASKLALWPARDAAGAAQNAAWAALDDPERCVVTPWTGPWDAAAGMACIAVANAAAAGARNKAVRDAVGAAAFDKEQDWQYHRLVARLGDPEPEDWPLPAAG